MKKNRREAKSSDEVVEQKNVDRMIEVRPADGFVVTDPATGNPLPGDGATVKDSPYWRRRLRDGLAIDIGAKHAATSDSDR